MIGGAVTILELLKAVDESTKVWVGALIRELWSFRGLGVTPREQWSGRMIAEPKTMVRPQSQHTNTRRTMRH